MKSIANNRCKNDDGSHFPLVAGSLRCEPDAELLSTKNGFKSF